MTKEQTPIEYIFTEGLIDLLWEVKEGTMHPNEAYKLIEKKALTKANAKVLEALEDKYSHDDITHALAYGFKCAKIGLVHSEVLKHYKEEVLKQK